MGYLQNCSKEELLEMIHSGDILCYMDEYNIKDYAEECLDMVNKDEISDYFDDKRTQLKRVKENLCLNDMASIDMIIEEIKKLEENGYR